MSADPRIDELLERILESDCSAEDACREHPELLDDVRRSLKNIRRFEAEVNEIFPPTSVAPSYVASGLDGDTLPAIPGYDVNEILGRGGVGIVYKAQHLKLDRPVALKMLLAGGYAGAAELTRFIREAQAVAALDHPGIVQVHDVGEFDGRPYYTMEFLQGGSLAQHLGGTPQPADEAATVVIALSQAIHAAHQRGIVHRDLKPGNVLLNLDGTPKISDFGLARFVSGDGSLTISGAGVGTPSYMAPEQTGGNRCEIGPAADVYSLGAILYEMVTGRPPFRGESALETQRQVVADDPIPPSRLNPSLPRDLETICLTCLRKERRVATHRPRRWPTIWGVSSAASVSTPARSAGWSGCLNGFVVARRWRRFCSSGALLLSG